ncbi:MAG: BlaI/MecI/CopY family transcriptional regulator [candidate division Zixibacteria bacterium]|nr:BlaI/MecI/CopY family transcriptional regulator [candidate division Zixibacteria bacterium]
MANRAEPTVFFRPARSGLAKFCGELEAKVMETVWANGAMTVKRALYFLNKDHRYAYTTIMTVMNRLVEKAFLTRTKQGHSFLYAPTMNKNEFLDYAIGAIITSLNEDYRTETASHIGGSTHKKRKK